MKRTVWSKVTCLLFAAVLCVSMGGLAGCGNKKGENELWFVYFKGGYGTEWAEQLAKKFEAENPGVKVEPTPNSQLIDDVPNFMENGSDYDLIFCHDVAWEDFVYPGWIHCLDDLYATDVGGGSTFKDRIWDDDVLDSCTYPDANGVEHYYKVPWTIGTAGIAYNVTVMDRLDAWLASSNGQAYLATDAGNIMGRQNNTARRWGGKAPETYYDLWQLCNDVVAARLPVVESDPTSGVIVPFTWSGKSEEWQWDYAVFDWWGQLTGPETLNTFKNFGNVNENYELDWSKTDSPDMTVYDPNKKANENNGVGWWEFKQAYNLWYSLIVGNKSKQWSHSGIDSFGKYENESAFAYGQALMTPAACWIEYESKEFLDDAEQEVSIMASPIVSHVRFDNSGNILLPYQDAYKNFDASSGVELDAIHATAADVTANKNTIKRIGDEYYNRVSFTSSFGDSVMIPENASNKELAEKFILFMQREDNVQLFTYLSGGTVLPYKYDYAGSFAANNATPTKWQSSIFEINANSTKFNNYTKHPMMRQTQLKGTARMTTMWPRYEYFYFKSYDNASVNTYKPDTLFNTIYNTVSSLWNQWKGSY